MPEALVPGDVEQYTAGRLSQSDPETVRFLDAALTRVRRYCGWHVSPVRTETIIIDGSGTSLLVLPTLKIVELISVTEDDVALDPAIDVKISAAAGGVIAKTQWRRWCPGFSNIEVELSHGYTAAEAGDFREAVLSLIDDATMQVGTGRTGPLVGKRVDDVEYSWAGKFAQTIEQSILDTSILSKFRLHL
jgi:hypothetical protein